MYSHLHSPLSAPSIQSNCQSIFSVTRNSQFPTNLPVIRSKCVKNVKKWTSVWWTSLWRWSDTISYNYPTLILSDTYLSLSGLKCFWPALAVEWRCTDWRRVRAACGKWYSGWRRTASCPARQFSFFRHLPPFHPVVEVIFSVANSKVVLEHSHATMCRRSPLQAQK